MTTSSMCVLPYCLIPLSSEEPLWEWDIVSDALFMSQGALKTLNLAAMPRHMADFYQHLPPAAATELVALREGIISGRNGSVLECGYICNGLWIKEYLMVMTRNSAGRATRAMGRFTSAQVGMGDLEFRNGDSGLPSQGIWIYNVQDGMVWQDSVCARLVGAGGPRKYSIKNVDAALNLHPADQESVRRHYRLFLGGVSLGDNITDIMRLRNSSGNYSTVLVRAIALERDEKGHALLVAGVISPGERKNVELERLEKDDRLYHALQNFGAGQWNWDAKLDTVYFCPRFLGMLGYRPEYGEELARSWRDHIHPDDLQKVLAARQSIINSKENGDSFECTYRMRRSDGEWAWIFDRGFVLWRDDTGSAGQVLGSITNITTAQLEREKLEDLVRHDSLTGLRSRAFCDLELEHIERNDIRPVTVISVDITGLKMVNDNLGHARGDELLTKAATILSNSLRRTDFIARMGGDEFLVLLPSCGPDKGLKLLGKVEESFASYNAQPNVMPVIAAAGMACTTSMKESVESAIARADAAMYKNKKANRRQDHASIRAWIKSVTGKEVSSADDRVD